MPAYENDLFDYKLSDGSDAMYCIYGLHTVLEGRATSRDTHRSFAAEDRTVHTSPYLTYLTLHSALPP